MSKNKKGDPKYKCWGKCPIIETGMALFMPENENANAGDYSFPFVMNIKERLPSSFLYLYQNQSKMKVSYQLEAFLKKSIKT